MKWDDRFIPSSQAVTSMQLDKAIHEAAVHLGYTPQQLGMCFMQAGFRGCNLRKFHKS